MCCANVTENGRDRKPETVYFQETKSNVHEQNQRNHIDLVTMGGGGMKMPWSIFEFCDKC